MDGWAVVAVDPPAIPPTLHLHEIVCILTLVCVAHRLDCCRPVPGTGSFPDPAQHTQHRHSVSIGSERARDRDGGGCCPLVIVVVVVVRQPKKKLIN